MKSLLHQLVLMAGLVAASSLDPVFSAPTAFNYQGQLTDGGVPANGFYSMQFTLFDASIGGRQLGPILGRTPVQVSGGFFSIILDFDIQIFTDTNRWLEIGVRTN